MGRGDVGQWERIRSSRDTAAHSISWDFVHAFGFGPDGQIWYGTVGNGWGLSTDGGRTWRNWDFGQLGPEWQYVAPEGIVTRGDTTYIGTADGIKLTFDDGATWHDITDSAQAARGGNRWGHLASQYVLALGLAQDSSLLVALPRGAARSLDGGRTFAYDAPWHSCHSPSGVCARHVLGWPLQRDSGRVLEPIRYPWQVYPARVSRFPQLGAPSGAIAVPAAPRHTWFQRPIAVTDQPHIDQTYRYGSTMGGNFQQHQGVEFNNADGTPVQAIGNGVVVWAGPAERGALTVAIRHDRKLEIRTPEPRTRKPDPRFLYSVYYHNSRLLTSVGQTVRAGDVIALVGNTGRATNDHLHLEVHAVPVDSVRLVVDPDQRFPPHSTNPELWIEPLPGTGLVAGQVWDSQGQPVRQARIYGLTKVEPAETPFSFIETYGDRAHSSPAYHDHFAIGDVPPGEYTLGVEIEGQRVSRKIRVEAGQLTWVEFRP
jgi:murein DD-endopeptidase MepM/ murein hydrolase activator NlpD